MAYEAKTFQRGKERRVAETAEAEVRLRYDGFAPVKEKAPAPAPSAKSESK